ncbi:unnamed protein product [Vitrella brassicaformis CCMP3155]|uniref:Aminotransferase class I/classII large domain-containing protein n=1 Tax=Vitrella brassicaformis (strain CCMP3155) TaxID=1169540 RepID=A0A0G4GRF8_VITBC|nr:unnamed protein product [Vitrella brassicaformis CCMP3155]|eukprot:CEM33135.1 unnamed protein product [Vitrella brassicaformis CCMP3155]
MYVRLAFIMGRDWKTRHNGACFWWFCTVLSHIKQTIRPMYFSPPSHGGRLALLLLTKYRTEWESQLADVSSRVASMRRQLREAIEKKGTRGSWEHITQQIGIDHAFTRHAAHRDESAQDLYDAADCAVHQALQEHSERDDAALQAQREASGAQVHLPESEPRATTDASRLRRDRYYTVIPVGMDGSYAELKFRLFPTGRDAYGRAIDTYPSWWVTLTPAMLQDPLRAAVEVKCIVERFAESDPEVVADRIAGQKADALEAGWVSIDDDGWLTRLVMPPIPLPQTIQPQTGVASSLGHGGDTQAAQDPSRQQQNAVPHQQQNIAPQAGGTTQGHPLVAATPQSSPYACTKETALVGTVTFWV